MTKKVILAVITCFMVLAGAMNLAWAAVSLGSVQGRNCAEIAKGGETQFRFFVFNAHGEGMLHLNLDAEYPFGLGVEIWPKSLSLPYIPLGEVQQAEGYEILSTNQGNIMVRPVVVKVFSTNDTAPGEYEIRVTASTRSSGGMMGVSQVRAFRFRVRVLEEGGEEKEDMIEEDMLAKEKPAGEEGSGSEERGTEKRRGEDNENKKPGGGNILTKHIEDARDAINTVTGSVARSVINNPVIAPVVLLVVIIAGLYLRVTDRI